MADFTYRDSVHKFTDPIRYFKANDPYYWEVENIPLKQIHQNVMWLRDQVGKEELVINVDRSNITELQPYTTGEDNVVRVKPGRYSARINDAYDITKLQVMSLIWGFNGVGQIDAWDIGTANEPNIKEVIDSFKSSIAGKIVGMNGLSERCFSYISKNEDFGDYGSPEDRIYGSDPTYVFKTPNDATVYAPFPVTEVLTWYNSTGKDRLIFNRKGASATGNQYEVNYYNLNWGFMDSGAVENAAIKLWRGTARISIVDVPEELSIDVPSFDSKDFFYYDEEGNKQDLVGATANSRVDLLFIYSKPVDSSGVTIAKWDSQGNPTKITKPQLGLVRGAGIGVDFSKVDINDLPRPRKGVDEDGNTMILPSIHDQTDPNIGFTNMGAEVKGSFPSPDDLLNVAPLLAESLESNSPALVGQSILPLAYIHVKDGAGNLVLAESDVVDIRPFLRTAELAYNERAGIAAAQPQINLGNPVVSKALLDFEAYKTKVYGNQKLAELEAKLRKDLGGGGGGGSPTSPTLPRVVATGHVLGGSAFGPESCILQHLAQVESKDANSPELLDIYNKKYLPGGGTVPSLPEWDKPNWVYQGNNSSPGLLLNDYIHTAVIRPNTNTNASFQCYSSDQRTTRIENFGVDNVERFGPCVSIHYVSKTIKIKTKPTWMKDYVVDVQLKDCVPISSRSASQNSQSPAGASNVWVEKSEDEFTIFVAWAGTDYDNSNEKNYPVPAGDSNVGGGTNWAVPSNNRTAPLFAGFMVMINDWNGGQAANSYIGAPKVGVSNYPSVTWKVTGIPSNFGGSNTNKSEIVLA